MWLSLQWLTLLVCPALSCLILLGGLWCHFLLFSSWQLGHHTLQSSFSPVGWLGHLGFLVFLLLCSAHFPLLFSSLLGGLCLGFCSCSSPWQVVWLDWLGFPPSVDLTGSLSHRPCTPCHPACKIVWGPHSGCIHCGSLVGGGACLPGSQHFQISGVQMMTWHTLWPWFQTWYCASPPCHASPPGAWACGSWCWGFPGQKGVQNLAHTDFLLFPPHTCVVWSCFPTLFVSSCHHLP